MRSAISGRPARPIGVAIAWSAAGSALCFTLVKLVMPLTHTRDAERDGLDIADHGERAYNYRPAICGGQQKSRPKAASWLVAGAGFEPATFRL
jgi:hypothetical protein